MSNIIVEYTNGKTLKVKADEYSVGMDSIYFYKTSWLGITTRVARLPCHGLKAIYKEGAIEEISNGTRI